MHKCIHLISFSVKTSLITYIMEFLELLGAKSWSSFFFLLTKENIKTKGQK